MKRTLVLGATGATGRLVVKQLLEEGIAVRAIVRRLNLAEPILGKHQRLEIIEANICEMTDDELKPILNGVDSVICCLGHNLTFKGVFGHPRKLVTDSVIKVTRLLDSMKPSNKVKFILMNTTGNSNRDIPEKTPLSQSIVVGLLRLLLPPHVDNESAADHLRLKIGQHHPFIEWVAVRPDALTNEAQVTPYDIHPSPIRNPIFDSGDSSRINVANFMLNLVSDTDLWKSWAGQMPVLYNRTKND